MKRKYIVASFLLVISVLLFRREKPERGKRSGEIVAVISYGLPLQVESAGNLESSLGKRKEIHEINARHLLCVQQRAVSFSGAALHPIDAQNNTHFNTCV